MEFRVGQKVRVNRSYYLPPIINKCGTIIDIEEYIKRISVKFDFKDDDFLHSCGGVGPDGQCRYFRESDLSPLIKYTEKDYE
jgi:hypothetical protein